MNHRHHPATKGDSKERATIRRRGFVPLLGAALVLALVLATVPGPASAEVRQDTKACPMATFPVCLEVPLQGLGSGDTVEWNWTATTAVNFTILNLDTWRNNTPKVTLTPFSWSAMTGTDIHGNLTYLPMNGTASHATLKITGETDSSGKPVLQNVYLLWGGLERDAQITYKLNIEKGAANSPLGFNFSAASNYIVYAGIAAVALGVVLLILSRRY